MWYFSFSQSNFLSFFTLFSKYSFQYILFLNSLFLFLSVPPLIRECYFFLYSLRMVLLSFHYWTSFNFRLFFLLIPLPLFYSSFLSFPVWFFSAWMPFHLSCLASASLYIRQCFFASFINSFCVSFSLQHIFLSVYFSSLQLVWLSVYPSSLQPV